MEAGRKSESIRVVESKPPMPNDNQASKPATKRAPKLGQIGRANSAVKKMSRKCLIGYSQEKF